MSAGNDDSGEAVVAFVSGVLVGVAASLLFVRMKRNHAIGTNSESDDYCFDGGDLFI